MTKSIPELLLKGMFPLSSSPIELSLDEVKEMMLELDTDPLKNSGIRVVMPVGDGSSGIMFIGEAPGEKEDQIGEPFVGASGKFLNETLLPSVGLTRQNIYLTNIVKCRPPANRDPTDEEKNAWSLVLVAEIIAVRPKLIACLGRHSMGFFLPEAKISQIHGQVQSVAITDILSIPILALYHPAAALYNPTLRQVLQQDFLQIGNFWSGDMATPQTDIKPEAQIQTKTLQQSDIDEGALF